MEPAALVDERFQAILARIQKGQPPSSLSDLDRAIWLIVSVRCEIDINGFNSVFDQLLTEEELQFLVGSLARLGEPALSAAFDRARRELRRYGFTCKGKSWCDECGAELKTTLAEIATLVNAEQALWGLDAKLAEQIEKTSTGNNTSQMSRRD